MARIARSDQPLYQTRGRPVSWPVTMTDPDGSALDLTGATALARLTWTGVERALSIVGALGPSGVFRVAGPAALTADLPTGKLNELWLTLTDSQGGATDYVWPVIGEIP